jgi:hypothetical protein
LCLNVGWILLTVSLTITYAQQNTGKPIVNLPCDGGMLTSKVTFDVKPIKSAEARAANAQGFVIVRIWVDEGGRVYNANACAGHPLLRQSSVLAAYRARLLPTVISGTAVKVTGILEYVFKAGKAKGRLYKP